ncbi:DUF1998 domain-containing protein [Williamsia sp.]|uniref:DUF1998 domain-containing protein n=1 Tax=Williamsia sp. TaxID=1872085 RepID=UPI002F92D5FE
MTDPSGVLYDSTRPLDPMGDAETLEKDGARKNFAKVGSARPSSLLYTYGPGSIMDLPHFTIMPSGLDDWDRVWKRRGGIPTVHAPRLLEVVRVMLGSQVGELRPFPWEPKPTIFSQEGRDLGVPARVFPQWMRCTGCDRLAPISVFDYTNTKPFRTDDAIFEHSPCHGRRGRVAKKGSTRRPVVPARYLLACVKGHLDEFPYDWWVHEGSACAKADVPVLKMRERAGGKGASAVIVCESCNATRPMNEAQGDAGRAKLPLCRGRLPHLDGFADGGCAAEPRLMLVGASNLWFPATLSIIDMPRLDPKEQLADDADRIRVALGDNLTKFSGKPDVIRALLDAHGVPNDSWSDTQLQELISAAIKPPMSEDQRQEKKEHWNPIDLLVPEWRYLQRDPASDFHTDERSGLTLSPRAIANDMPAGISRVLAVDRLRKVNAVVGFTRIDELDRVNDVTNRLVSLTRTDRPKWTVATEDRGEGVFLQLDEDLVRAWEDRVASSELWASHKAAHRRNFGRRFSETAEVVNPEERMQPPRYWLLHTLAHSLIREMAMDSGYGAASLSERIYAWRGDGTRPAAAGILICTTASDSDGTLGGLVRLSEPDLLAAIVSGALHRAGRCSSDPVCAVRTPHDPEDFLHGAACHCCVMASETSCERANRFLDRRFLLALPGSDLGFFGRPDDW